MSSNQINLMDATSIAPMKPSQFLEEKKWPPLDIMNNHHWKKRLPANISSNSGSQPVVHQFGTTSPSLRPSELNFGNNTRISWEHLSNSDEHRNYSNSLKLELEPLFRIKVTLRFKKIRFVCSFLVLNIFWCLKICYFLYLNLIYF